MLEKNTHVSGPAQFKSIRVNSNSRIAESLHSLYNYTIYLKKKSTNLRQEIFTMNKILLVKYLDLGKREHVEIRRKNQLWDKELLNQTNLMQKEPTLDAYLKL